MPDPELVEVRASRARIVDVADALRRKLERDLHDGAQQRLTSVVLALGLVSRALEGPVPGDAAELVTEAAAELNRALAELRELARDLYPVLLTDAGLGPALTSLADRSVRCRSSSPTFRRAGWQVRWSGPATSSCSRH
jgi:signal transduction histidine kinase